MLALHMARIRALAARLDDVSLTAAVRVATEDLQATSAELRELARGIHPPILTEEGLSAAVEVLAERCSIPVRVTALPARRLPERVEAIAYYVIAEALTNAVRYADAERIRVGAALDGAVLEVTVVDDGAGGADPSAGTGLDGLADRVGAVGGSMIVDSPAGAGTAVRATIPLDDD
jgi:signal transduction histidine kinase